jgi:hypothetical protein
MPRRDEVALSSFILLILQSTFGKVLKKISLEIKHRFDCPIPDPSEDVYFPTELIASALDPHTKSLAFVPASRHERVSPLLTPNRLFRFHFSYFQVWRKVADLLGQVTVANAIEDDLEDDGSMDKNEGEDSDEDDFDTIFGNQRQSMSELERYKSHPPPHKSENVLEWWKSVEASYPNLSKLARV